MTSTACREARVLGYDNGLLVTPLALRPGVRGEALDDTERQQRVLRQS